MRPQRSPEPSAVSRAPRTTPAVRLPPDHWDWGSDLVGNKSVRYPNWKENSIQHNKMFEHAAILCCCQVQSTRHKSKNNEQKNTLEIMEKKAWEALSCALSFVLCERSVDLWNWAHVDGRAIAQTETFDTQGAQNARSKHAF